MSTANILANDPSFSHWGWVVVQVPQEIIVAYGCINSSPGHSKGVRGVSVAEDDRRRTQFIYQNLFNLVAKYNVDGLMFEMPTGGAMDAASLGDLSRAGAIAASLEMIYGLPAEYITPGDVKDLAKPRKGAVVSKSQVEMEVRTHEVFEGYFDSLRMDRRGKLHDPKNKHHPEWNEHCYDALAVYITMRDGHMVDRLIGREL